jgi:hypothetical protein
MKIGKCGGRFYAEVEDHNQVRHAICQDHFTKLEFQLENRKREMAR